MVQNLQVIYKYFRFRAYPMRILLFQGVLGPSYYPVLTIILTGMGRILVLPKNGEIPLWPNTRVVKCKYYVYKNKMGSIIRSSGTVFYSFLYLNSRLGFNKLKYLYSVISVKIDSLPTNTKNRESTRSWTAKMQFLHPWAASVTPSKF